MNNVLSPEDFVKRADEILGLIGVLRNQVGLEEAVRFVEERFVEAESHSELRRLGEVLAYARRQALVQRGLDDDREALHHGHLEHDQLVSTGHHYEMLREQACTYNHLLRGLIEACGHQFSREQLHDWLSAASQGRADWARAEMTGAVSEIALHAALQGLPELKDMRYATVAEDLAGYDFVGTWQGAMVTIDAKTGFYAPLVETKHGHRHLEISVPHEAVHGLSVNHAGLALLRREVRSSLQQDSGTQFHAPHHYFRAQTA
jgi:hypothetical protein